MKQKILSFPNKDPKTGEMIKIGGKRYKALEEKYGTPKIKSPKTQFKIGVGKGEYKKLIKEGYTDDQLLYNKKEGYTDEQLYKKTIFNFNDIQIEIILKMTYPEIMNYCQIDKQINMLCHDNKTWQLLIERDFLPFLDNDLPDSKDRYEIYYKFFDQFITTIIAEFLIYKTKILNLDNVYQSLYKILIRFFDQNSVIDLDEDADNNYILQNTLELNTILEIFNVLTIPIKKSFMPNQVNPPSNRSKNDNYDKMKFMSFIFFETFDKWFDL